MMRRTRIPHAKCGSTRVGSRRIGGLRLTPALALLATVALVLTVAALPSAAQDPSATILGITQPKSSFPKTPGGPFGPAPKIDKAQPLYMQADQLLYDTKSSRVIAQGNVEIYYNNFILTADQVVYDQSTNKLVAEGNAQLKDPNGSITRADRFEALDDFRDAFIQSLSVVTTDDTRIAAAACQPAGRQHHRIRERQVHAVQERARHAAAVVHQRHAHHPRSAGGNAQLPGCQVRVLRRPRDVPALFRDTPTRR